MKKKSAYKPRGIRLDNMSWVMSGLKKVGSLPTAGVDLKVKNHAALASVLKGEGTRGHVDTLIGAFNMCEALTRLRADLGRDWASEIRAGQDALHAMAKRGVAQGIFVFTGPEMNAVRLCMDVHDAQLDACTVRELEKAMFIVAEEIRLKKARPISEKQS